MARVKPGNKIRIKKQVFIEKGNKFSLDPGETFVVESSTVTGAVRITKTYSTGVTKKAVVAKAFYERV